MIDERYQSKGIGKLVFEKIITHAKNDEKINVVKTDYIKGNESMKHLLEKLGFKKVKEEEREILNELIIR